MILEAIALCEWEVVVKKNKPAAGTETGNQLTREARLQLLKEAITAKKYPLDNATLANTLLYDLLQEQWLRMRIKNSNC